MLEWIRGRKKLSKRLGREAKSHGHKQAPAVIFVHGLGSSPERSWASMIALCETDPSLQDYSFDCYSYPTTKLFVWPMRRAPRLHELAKGLATEIRLRHFNREQLIFICHSMGGLIVRQYMVECARNKKSNYIDRTLLLATPNSGATLAAVGKNLSSRNSHIKLLAPFSEELERLNDDWARLSMENSTTIKYVAGGADMIVSEPSAKGMAGRELDDMLIGYDHETIISGSNHSDLNYLLIKEFILNSKQSKAKIFSKLPSKCDPLFEIYRIENEEFYLIRSSDASILNATEGGHVWISGPSGLGKTASLQRRAILSGVKIIHIFLSSVTDPTPENLIRTICIEIADVVGSEQILQQGAMIDECVQFIRRVIRKHAIDEHWAILIEEIPISLENGYGQFISFLDAILLGLEAEKAHHIKLLFSSIIDINTAVPRNAVKFRTRVQMIPFKAWTASETKNLVEMLSKATGIYPDPNDQLIIANASCGSPRFIKAIFRKWRNGIATDLPLRELLDVVKAEQVQ